MVTSLQGGQAPLTVFLQQGGQLKDMFGGLGPAARALGGYVASLVSPFTLAAAGIGVLAFAYSKGSQESSAYSKALILTGNAAGTTANQLSNMAASIAKTNSSLTRGGAAEALTTLAETGAIGVENLERYAAAAANFEIVAGQSVEKTAEAFKDLQKEPLDAAVKLDSKIHFLTATTYEHIKSLQDQGKASEAARAAQNAYADALEARSKQLSQNLGFLENSWRSVGNTAKGAWDAMLGVGRSQTGTEQLASLKQQLADRTSRGPLNGLPGVSDAFEKGNAALRAQISYIERVNDSLGKQATVQAASTKQVQARAEWDKEGEKFLSNRLKREQEIAKVRAAGVAAGASESDIQDRIKNINEKFKDPKGAAPKAFQDDAATKFLETLRQTESTLKDQLAGELKITGEQREQVKFQQLIADLKDKKILTAEQKSLMANKDAIDAQLAKNAALSGQIKFEEKIAEIVKQSGADAEALRRTVESIDASIASGASGRAEQYDRMIDSLGLGEQARKMVEAEKSIRNEFRRYQLRVDDEFGKKDMLGSDAYAEATAKIKASLGDALATQKKYYADEAAARADWKLGATAALADYAKYVDDVAGSTGRTLSDSFKGAEDAIVSFATTGKLSFKSLADSIIANMVRMAVQQSITGPLAKGFLGLLGGSGVSSAALGGANTVGAFGGDALGALISLGGLDKRAAGGPVSSGTPYLVGEKGPEVFVPGASGGIVPNHALGGGGAPVSIVINTTVGDVPTLSMVREAQAGTERRIMNQLRRSRGYAGEAT
ncbi:phage tail tape measure protein [Variovorax sp. N23]|uniref:phage tail tape measure protein n=1 Tax=Variovorax sp. N23 TaxID=2980555 RepID=UPI0021C5CD43|nr:phage tail tape measure protein [Variovorax sp. N23]MCU4118871.1 phage tail tape measure protein [Variovorax sp. N23]